MAEAAVCVITVSSSAACLHQIEPTHISTNRYRPPTRTQNEDKTDTDGCSSTFHRREETTPSSLAFIIKWSHCFMHVFYLRLSSFLTWPLRAHASPHRLANSGFFYKNSGDDKVQCCTCHVTIRDWRPGDCPDERHRRASPDCDFLSGRGTERLLETSLTSDEISAACARFIDDHHGDDTALQELKGVLLILQNECTQSGVRHFSELSATVDTAVSEPSDQLRYNAGELDSNDNRTTYNERATNSLSPNQSLSSRISTNNTNHTASRENYTSRSDLQIGLPSSDLSTDSVDDPSDNPTIAPHESLNRSLSVNHSAPSYPAYSDASNPTPNSAYTLTLSRGPSSLLLTSMSSYDNNDQEQLMLQRRPTHTSAGNSGNSQEPIRNVSRGTGRAPESYDYAKMKEERSRLLTFRDAWSQEVPVTPAQLARAGFFFTGVADRVKCAFCFGALRNWEDGDCAMREHALYFPNCPFVIGEEVGNVPMETNDSIGTNDVDTPHAPSAGTSEPVKHPQYRDELARLESYQFWPVQLRQRPKQLAEAGFYYTGRTDSVTCFHCGGGLRNFESHDHIWESHAQFFPDCVFVKERKGEEFVKTAIAKLPVKTTKQSGQSPSDISGGNSNKDKNNTKKKRKTKKTRAVALAASNLASGSPPVSGDLKTVYDEIQSLRAQREEEKRLRLCKICLDEPACSVFLPCGHLVACGSCSSALRTCPICRAQVKGVVRTYNA